LCEEKERRADSRQDLCKAGTALVEFEEKEADEGK
jgi:hypothetical protein